ncbi:SDR family NAD(P)-dependent oxidoreductase [Amycolatopsis sp.]|uniref:SDR family NAD(P)-dependent oxidoreductase n=1 Tax=Amycolatopsis sp. TaxID=37632 RepID=UPI003457AF5E
MQNTPVALVTGANKGIGLQIAKDLAAHGFTVLVGSRNLENGETAAKNVGADARDPPERRVSRRSTRGVRDQPVRRHRRHASNVATPS